MRFGGRNPPLSPDPELVRSLALLLSETGLSEIEYAVGDHRIRVARASAGTGRHASQPAAPDNAALGEPTTSPAGHPGAVISPMVGTAYLAPQPGAAAFVRLGESVAEGQPLLIIEAMKVMNEIRASRSGRIAQILVTDAQPVEYGAVLMVIE
ncbi:MAG TPA: biotin/lipoyl-containing protein [Stellaceae bacterium]